MNTKKEIEAYIINNLDYSKFKLSLFFLPVFLLIAIVLFLYSLDSLGVDEYIQVQKSTFLFINHNLGQYPSFQFNFTQVGDALVFLSLLSMLMVYIPKTWEYLLSGLLVSLLFSSSLKKIFAVPRPAAVFENDHFIIMGKALFGNTSFPSGHSITIFTILTVLLFAFTPQQLKYKMVWFFFIIILGLILAFTRVGVGAHYPLDVIVGSIIGYISGLSGIFISQKYKIWAWVTNKKYFFVFILFFLICCISLISKIASENLIIFYVSLVCVSVSLYKTIVIYVKK